MAEQNPNTSFRGNPQNQWDLDNRSAFANGAAGSITPKQLWAAELRAAQRTNNWWEKFMRQGHSSPICFEKRPGEAGGASVVLRGVGQLGGAGKMGDNLFVTAADFGDIPLKEWTIGLEVHSNAYGVSRHVEEMLGIKDELSKGTPGQLGAWGGQYVGRHVDMGMIHKCATSSRSVTGGKTIATLKSADTTSYDSIQTASWMMRDQGGMPFRAGKKANGEELWSMMFPLVDNAMLSLKRDSDYKQRVGDAGGMGNSSPFWTGSVPDLDGNLIMSRQTIVPQGRLPAGNPCAPIAYLGVVDAYDSNGANATLQGGGALYKSGDTTTPWFTDFPGYTFPFSLTDSLVLADSFWGSGPYYALVVNPLSAATDPGKVGMIRYTVGTGGNTLTVVDRLHGSVSTGVNATTVGSVTVTSLEAAGASFTADFAVGAAVIPCNALGVPIGIQLGVGAEALGFVRGDLWGDRFTEKVQGGMNGQNLFAGWTFGLAPYVSPNGFTPAISATAVALSYRGRYVLPNIT